MSNPDSSTPSIQALDLAVKPAGYSSWSEFEKAWQPLNGISKEPHSIALAYAADLDKADKVGRMVAEWAPGCPMNWHAVCVEVRKSLILPDPIDPDLLEVEKIAEARANSPLFIPIEETILAALKRGRELAAKEQDRG